MRRIIPVLLVTGSLLGGLPAISFAQNNPGFTINWGGDLPRKQQLSYRLDYGTPNQWDRYHLRLKPQKIAISQLSISYPDYYKGKFDPKAISFFANRKKVALSEVNLDKENRLIELTPQEVIPAETPVEVVLSNVKNPRTGGMYFFNARVSSPGDVPVPRYVGTWALSIFKN